VRLAGFALAFALILLLKWGTLTEPPYWDAAMGVFPPAITLSATGFDILGLLASPRFIDGGPNVHSTSPVTLVTAAVYMALGGGSRTLVVLHLLHFAVAAWALVLLHRLARPSFGSYGAALLCLAVLLHPTFSAQVSYLYLEMALFLCAVAAIHAWSEGRFWPAAIWGAMAWATKQTGGIVPAALAVATLLERRPARDKAKRMAVIAGLPALWTAAVAILTRIAVPESGGGVVPSLDVIPGRFGEYMRPFLPNVPDLLLYIAVFGVVAVTSARPILRALREEPTARSAREPERRERLVLGYAGLVIAFFLLFFNVALPLLFDFAIGLPRYYVVILPFLLLWMGYGVKRLAGRRLPRAPALTFGALAAVFAINTNGILYPSDVMPEGLGNDPPLAERSNAYRRLIALQLEGMQALEELPSGVPVYYGLLEHYLFRYPGMGYARGPLGDGHNFGVESLAPIARADPFPPCVYALYGYPWVGGDRVHGLIRLPTARPELTAEVVREFEDGPYEMRLVRIRQRGADCPA
jgi:hypothetical protein